MRVVASMRMRNLLEYLNRSYDRLQTYEENIATAKRIHKPSDDPVDAVKISNLKNLIQESRAYIKTVDSAYSWMSVTETNLDDLYDIVVEARETAMSAISSENSAETREILAESMDALFDRIMATANSKHLNFYIFGGTETMEEPFEWDEDHVVYHGNDEYTEMVIGSGVQVKKNIPGSQVFLENDDVFDVMHTIAESIRNNDQATLQDQLDRLGVIENQIISAQTEIGARIQHIDEMQNRYLDLEVVYKGLKGDLEGTDYAEAIMELTKEQISVKSTLSFMARVENLSLMDFLG